MSGPVSVGLAGLDVLTAAGLEAIGFSKSILASIEVVANDSVLLRVTGWGLSMSISTIAYTYMLLAYIAATDSKR